MTTADGKTRSEEVVEGLGYSARAEPSEVVHNV